MSGVVRNLATLAVRCAALVLAASVIVFVLLRAVPGNPAEVALGVTATPEEIAELSARLGLDRPLIVQYLNWLGGALTGDFGVSLSSGQEIAPLLAERAGVSVLLGGGAIALALALAVPLGVLATGRRAGAVVGALTQVGIAIPSFLAGIILVAVFAVRLQWFPANGWSAPYLPRLVLPILALTLVQAAILTRHVRSAVLDVEGADFMRTAHAAGQGRWEALARHGLRNAAVPVLTVTGLQMAGLVVGAVVVERVFVLPGLGTMLLDAVASRDLTTVQAVVMVLVVFTLVVNLGVDALTVLIDPRVRRPRAVPTRREGQHPEGTVGSVQEQPAREGAR